MGGASTQIAFEPTESQRAEHPDDLTSVRLRTLEGINTQYNVFSTTFLGFGVNEARRRYLETLSKFGSSNHTPVRRLPLLEQRNTRALNEGYRRRASGDSDQNLPATLPEARPPPATLNAHIDEGVGKESPISLTDPCLPSGLLLENPIDGNQGPSHILGTGSLEQCKALQIPLLNKTAE
ncbi:Golgi apyrase, partial [Dinochytrium kinnereticum]